MCTQTSRCSLAPPALSQARGAQEGDTVVIGEMEFEYSDERDEGAIYDKWYQERRAAGVVGRGQARWPHATG